MQVFKGQVGREYTLSNRVPFAFGRTSLLFAARDDNGSSVALKVFRSAPSNDDSAQFFNEIRAQHSLDHPNILPILDFGSATEYEHYFGPFLALPMCAGGNLRQRLKTQDFLPLRVALPLLTPIAKAVDHAHENGVIHGDLKPENILFGSGSDGPYLADFGVAKYFPIEERVTTVGFTEGGGAGSTAYMSPEQIEHGIQSPRSDIYSLAIIACEILTGALPFDVRVTPYKQMADKIAGRLLDPRSLNPLLTRNTCDGLKRALCTDRDQRPHSACEFVYSLVEGNATVHERTQPQCEVFISYCHKDDRWLRRIETVLVPLVRGDRIAVWSDRRIGAGSNWREQIRSALSSTRIAVLLVSHDFLASSFIAENELPPLLEAARSKGVKILWIAVSSSLYKSSVLSEFQAVNNPEKPLDCLSRANLNRELVKIAETIASYANEESGA